MSYTNVEENAKIIIDSIKRTDSGEEELLRYINETINTYGRNRHYFGVPIIPLIILNGIELDFLIVYKSEVETCIKTNEIVVPIEAIMKYYAH